MSMPDKGISLVRGAGSRLPLRHAVLIDPSSPRLELLCRVLMMSNGELPA
jgi:hypothetical protein